MLVLDHSPSERRSPLSVGSIVMLTASLSYLPPAGTVGKVVASDGDKTYLITFNRWPCPVPPGTFWFVHRSQLLHLA